MWVWVDRLGVLVIDAGASAAVLLMVAALAVLVSRQPARRVKVARATVFGLLALVPLEVVGLVPRLDVLWAVRGAWAPAGWDFGWMPAAVAVAHAAGVAAGLAGLGLGYVGLALVRRTSAEPSIATRAIYDALPHPAGAARPVLLVSAKARRPVLVGLFRPAILIPPTLDDPDDGSAARAGLRLALLHELAHAGGRDVGFTLAAQLARAFWFALPPVWWLAGRMRLDQEFLADRYAAAKFGGAKDYASSLVDLASGGVTPQGDEAGGRAPRLDAPAGDSPLVQRVLMLVRCPFPIETSPPVWFSRTLPYVAVAVTLAASSLSLRPDEPASSASAVPPGRKFRLARLEVAPSPPRGAAGRAHLFELPIRLPEQFELSLQVWGDSETLSRTRVAGLPIEPPPPNPDESALVEAWHDVRVLRDGEALVVWVDDHASTLRPEASSLTDWLSVEPAPDQVGHFRNLDMIW